MKPKFTIKIDTREQHPWLFQEKQYSDAGVIIYTLPIGDYSLRGFEENIAVERKSLNDYVNTIIQDKERFDRELERLGKMDRALIIVEASFNKVLEAAYESKAHPHSVMGKALSIYVKYNIPVYFCYNRNEAQFLCYTFLKQYWKMKDEQNEILDEEIIEFHKKYNMDEIFGKEYK